jgi:hypothetical protein
MKGVKNLSLPCYAPYWSVLKCVYRLSVAVLATYRKPSLGFVFRPDTLNDNELP